MAAGTSACFRGQVAEKRGLGGPPRRCTCWGGSKKCISGRWAPSGLVPVSANRQCAAGEEPSLSPPHIVRNIRNLRPLENTRRHSHQPPPPSVLFTPPFFTLSAVFERKMREEKKARERVQCQGRAVEKTSFLPACCSEWVIEVAVI